MSARSHVVGAYTVAALALLGTVAALLSPELAASRRLAPVGALGFVLALAYGVAGGPRILRIARAMLRKTALTYLSYRAQLVSLFAYSALTVALLFLAGKPFLEMLFGPVEELVRDGQVSQNLVLIVVVGFVAWPIFWRSWEITAVGVRQEQWEGTFESMIPLPGGAAALPFGYLYSRLLFTILFQLAILAALAAALPSGSLALDSPARLFEMVAILLVTVLCMWGMGLLFGGLAILYKQLGPVDLIVRTLFLFLAGIFVPLEVLPGWAQTLAKALPLTYAFDLLHLVAVDGVPLAEARRPLLILLAFTAAFVVAGNRLYRAYVEKARRQGAIQGY